MSGDRWGEASLLATAALLRDLEALREIDPSVLAGLATPWRHIAEMGRRRLQEGLPADAERLLSNASRDKIESDPLWALARIRAVELNGERAVPLLADALQAKFEREDELTTLAGVVEDAEKWRAPVPLGAPALPVLDPGWLPSWLGRWVKALADAYQVPAALPAGMALGALSAALAGTVRIRLSPDWVEELALYVAVILRSGERKSPVVREAKAPLERWEREVRAREAEHVAEEHAAHEMLVSRFEVSKGEAARAKDEPSRIEAEERVRRLAGEVAASHPPALSRLLADDATPEALASLLAAHGGRLAVMTAEGGLFDILGGRYTEGRLNLDVVLKAHAGEEHRVDRKGRAAEVIPRPLLALAFAVQPTVLEKLRENAALRGRGLMARFLYLLPKTALGRRDLDPPSVPSEVREEYRVRLTALLDWTYAQSAEPPADPHSADSAYVIRELRLSPGAARRHRELRASIEPRQHPETGDLNEVGDWVGKFPGAVARLAALLHLAEHGPAGAERPVGEATMARACELGGCLLAHALVALAPSGGPNLDGARAVLRWAREKRCEEFSAREAFNALRGQSRFPDMAPINAALRQLEELGHLRRRPDPPRTPGQAGQPPSPVYEVNPVSIDGTASALEAATARGAAA